MRATTPLPVLPFEIAAVWIQVGSEAARLSVVDAQRLREENSAQERFRFQCITREYVFPAIGTAGGTRFVERRTAFKHTHTAAMTWLNSSQARISARLGKVVAS